VTDALDRLKAALADRYAIERELGQGGMATVYLARDLKHEREVALKVVQPGLGAALGAERFLREIRTTAQLTHPHILPLLDSGEADGTLFYVMPYVEGESLRDRLAREKQLPLDEALRITREVADALAYAHGRGVIHRDIKPDNILLQSGHAVVADFGIARAMDQASGATLTGTGVSVGTPQYMSPEQAMGGRDLDGRSDLYSLGCVLYEMLAGEPPFTGPTAESVVRQHLSVEPRPVTALRPAVPPEIAQAVGRCLAKTPADRFATAAAFADALARPEEARAPLPRVVPRRLALKVTGGALLVVLAAVLVLHPWARRAEAGGGGAASRVIVLPYDNETGDAALEPLGRMAAEWITEGLAQTGEVQVVPNLMVVQALSGPDERSGAPGRLQRVAKGLESGIAVTGSYYRQGDSLEFHSSVVDVASGTSLGIVETVRGALRDPSAAVEAVRNRVTGVLALRLNALVGWELPPSARPPSYEAYRAYAAGMERWIAGDYLAAALQFERAYALDSTYLRALMLASFAFNNGGDPRRSDSLAQVLAPRKQALSPYDRYRLEFRLAGGDREAQLRAARAATALLPIGTARWALIVTLLGAGRPHEALANVQDFLRHGFVETLWSWYAVWGLHSELLHVLGEHERELVVAEQARIRLPTSLHVMEYEGRVLAALGRLDRLRALGDEILATAPQPQITPGDVLLSLVKELRAHGQRDAALELAGRALGWLDAQGRAERSAPGVRALRGRLLYSAERWGDAAGVFQTLAGDSTRRLAFLGFSGLLAARRGALDSARAVLAQLASLEGTNQGGSSTVWRARIAAVLGEREQAVTLLRQAFREGYAFGIGLHADQDLASLRGYAPFEAMLRPNE
jgi:TolB-like protein